MVLPQESEAGPDTVSHPGRDSTWLGLSNPGIFPKIVLLPSHFVDVMMNMEPPAVGCLDFEILS